MMMKHQKLKAKTRTMIAKNKIIEEGRAGQWHSQYRQMPKAHLGGATNGRQKNEKLFNRVWLN